MILLKSYRYDFERYRSGRNGAVLKTVWVQAHVGSNPTLSASICSIISYSFLIRRSTQAGRRGAPAKGVGRGTDARVQIPPSPPFSNPQTKRYSSFFIVDLVKGFEPSHPKLPALANAAQCLQTLIYLKCKRCLPE